MPYRSSHRRCSVRKGVLRNFAKFTGKNLCHGLFVNKVVGLACNFIKKETLAQVFSREFCKISQNTFLQNTSGRLLLNLIKNHISSYQEKIIQSRFSAFCMISASKNYLIKGLLFHSCTATSMYFFFRLIKITGYQECFLSFKLIEHVFLLTRTFN